MAEPFERLPTEAVHPGARRLDELDPQRVLTLLAREDMRAVRAVRAEAPRVERAAKELAKALSTDGRIFFVGAGTSGRLGVLEAAECPPTFGTDPKQVVAIVAGGDGAVFRSKEGAEDEAKGAVAVLRRERLRGGDVVVGISASSVTPFVRGALVYARRRRAGTVLVTCGPRPRGLADVVIGLETGAEVLAGSTRMKAGTATKLALNQMTLLAMIRLKKVHGPYMVDVRSGSRKLRERAARIVASIAGIEREKAKELLERAGYEVKTAVVMARFDVSPTVARRRLDRRDGDLRATLLGR